MANKLTRNNPYNFFSDKNMHYTYRYHLKKNVNTVTKQTRREKLQNTLVTSKLFPAGYADKYAIPF